MTHMAKKVCFVSTIAWPLDVYMGPHIRKISETNRVLLICDGAFELSNGQFNNSVCYKQLDIPRKVCLIKDFFVLFKLWRTFRLEQFDVVHSITPKAGLLAMLAAKAAGIPIRFHTFTGQVWVTRSGLWRRFLMFLDWLLGSLATKTLTDSFSQQKFLISKKIIKSEKVSVLGRGSVVGVDTNRFSPNEDIRHKGRMEIGVSSNDFIFLFIGRLNHDKGIRDLLDAFSSILYGRSNIHLLIVGPDEGGYDSHISAMPNDLKKLIHRVGFTREPEKYMAMSDVICLPSYREGFGSVLIEAASSNLPAIASRIYGISDAVVDNVTGILHEPGNITELANCMLKLFTDESLRLEMGSAARARAIRDFSQGLLVAEFQNFYCKHGI